jgi:hypothetical protein
MVLAQGLVQVQAAPIHHRHRWHHHRAEVLRIYGTRS